MSASYQTCRYRIITESNENIDLGAIVRIKSFVKNNKKRLQCLHQLKKSLIIQPEYRLERSPKDFETMRLQKTADYAALVK